MFGARTSQVFTSRWRALIWSAGIMATAYCTIPEAQDDSAATSVRPGQPSEQELQAQQIIRNLDALKNR